MTEREQKMIECYLPHPRDPELGDNEYYVCGDYDNKVYRVYIADILPDFQADETYYGVYTVGHSKPIKACTRTGGYRMASLYDNKTDCRNSTHGMYNNWEALRELQRKGA